MPLTCLKTRKSLLFLILVLGIPLFAQTNKIAIFFTCNIVDSATFGPIAYTHIYNESHRQSYIANSGGRFSFSATVGDTLAIMAMGYQAKVYTIKATDTFHLVTISLKQQAYEIEAVRVDFPKTYQEFKKAFLLVDLEKGRPMPELPKFNPYKTPILLDTTVFPSRGFYLSPVTALYNKYSKEVQSQRKVWYLEQQELRQLSVDKKYNRELVTEITGFVGDDLINFMGYCNFSFNFLCKSTPLEIVETIYGRYNTYLNCCYKKMDTTDGSK